MDKINIEYRELKNQGTGSHDLQVDSRTIEVPFDKYLIKIRLSSKNEFLGIEEVVVNKEFLSYSQQFSILSSSGYHDVDDYYQEEEE
jgi:hypothetical protein